MIDDLGGPSRDEEVGAVPVTAELVGAVDTLATRARELRGWAATEAVVEIERQIARLTGITAQLLSAVEADGLWAVDGDRSVAGWYARTTGSGYHRAKDRIDLSRALRDHLPRTGEALVAGEVAVDKAMTLMRHTTTSEPRREALAAPAEQCGEEFLLVQANLLPAALFSDVVRNWAAATDPEADERGYREASEAEFFQCSPTTGGYHLAGFLTLDHGAAVDAALSTLMAPGAPDDTRTTQQRRAGALTALARLTLDHGLVGTGSLVRPHINVVVDLDTLTRTLTGALDRDLRAGSDISWWTGPADETFGGVGGDHAKATAGTSVGRATATGPPTRPDRSTPTDSATRPGRGSPTGSATAPAAVGLIPVADIERFAVAEILGAGPIPPSVLARLACDSTVSRLVFGPRSQVIDAGRSERCFSGPRRLAIIARDRTCRYPGCGAPPALCECHHTVPWADLGDSNTDEGILLCWHHHEHVHARGIDIDRTPTGGWNFSRDGAPLHL